MRTRTRIGVIAAVAVVAAASIPAAAIAGSDRGKDKNKPKKSYSMKTNAVALKSGGTRIARFAVSSPQRIGWSQKVTGLAGDDRLVGIDYRVQDGNLYGVGDEGGVYAVGSWSGRATKVSQLSVDLAGDRFGVDFNPAANRLRVVSDTGQNLRHNIDDGATAGTTIVDGTLTYPPATTAASGITAAAYTNNDLDTSTATTLFDLDTALDQVALQSPANAGSLAATGKLGVDAGSDAGFDVYSDLDRSGTTVSVKGYAVLRVGGRSGLYGVDLLTGKAEKIGSFGTGVTDIAVDLDR